MRLLVRILLVLVLLISATSGTAQAGQRVIVRSTMGQALIEATCNLLGCSVLRGLGDPAAQLFLVIVPDTSNLVGFIATLSSVSGIADVEPDLLVRVASSGPPIPQSLYETNVVGYFGASVREGYVTQPAVGIVRLIEAQQMFHVSGAGIVAVIDTGVDSTHPALAPVLVNGYDFTRNQNGGSESGDVSQSTAAVVDGVLPAYVNANTAAVIDQSTAAVVDNSQYADFGHGTMVAGIVHLVAPGAAIMPLKAFGPDGSGYTSDILRSIYWATRGNARVINMSFSMPQSSPELKKALSYATDAAVVCVAAAGNDGQSVSVYPAAYTNVIGVASTTNSDIRSSFSNYGSSLVWLAAPGEGVITTYPFGTYAAAWGTSFSTPFVSGAASLLLEAVSSTTPAAAATALGNAVTLSPDLGHGRLDILDAVQAVRATH